MQEVVSSNDEWDILSRVSGQSLEFGPCPCAQVDSVLRTTGLRSAARTRVNGFMYESGWRGAPGVK